MDSRMKQTRWNPKVIALVVLAIVVAAGAGYALLGALHPTGSPRPALEATDLTATVASQEHVPDTSHDDEGARALDTLAIELLRQADAVQAGDSALVSPISIASALGMTANGAEGATRQQMESALGLDLDTLNTYLDAQRQAMPKTPEEEGDPAVRLSNSIWIRETPELEVEQTFLEAAASWYDASIFSAPFDQTTARDINGWVRYGTDGMIDQLVDEGQALPEEAMVYLINALAFEGAWEDPYDDAFVTEEPFTREDGSQEDVQLMYSYEGTYFEADLSTGKVIADEQQSLTIDDTDRLTGFMKRYQGGDFAFAALLPPKGITVADAIARLDGGTIASLLQSPWENPVDAYLPAFSYDYGCELADALRALGMTDAFDTVRADFSAMSGTVPLYISKVIHKTHIDVDQAGTRAAAVTAVEMEAGASAPGEPVEPKEVRLDRPFIYLIVDTRTDTPLFVGTYMG